MHKNCIHKKVQWSLKSFFIYQNPPSNHDLLAISQKPGKLNSQCKKGKTRQLTKYKSNTYFHCFFHVFVSVWMKFGSVKHCYDDLLLMGQISAIAFTYLNRVNGFLLVTKSSSFNAKMRKTLFSILKITF